MTSRGGPKKTQKTTSDVADSLATFNLPDSLPCSDIEFPELITRKMRANWNDILKESEEKMEEIDDHIKSKKEPILKSPFLKTRTEYLKTEVFIYLFPALEDTLIRAKMWNVFTSPKCLFNGIDHIAQVLWNNNPNHLFRKYENLHIFTMPWVQKTLKKWPRPYYPKSWLWPEDYAATLIQKTVRQYFIQKQDEVQEMREFWRRLEMEQNLPEIDINPFLSRKFASVRHLKNPPPQP